MFCFFCFFTLHGEKKTQIHLFNFWKNLWRPNLLMVLSDLYEGNFIENISWNCKSIFFSNAALKIFQTYCGLLLWLHGWSRSVNLERLAIYWPGCVFWAFLWLFPALKLKPNSTEAKYAGADFSCSNNCSVSSYQNNIKYRLLYILKPILYIKGTK